MTDRIEGPAYQPDYSAMEPRRPARKLSARTAVIGAALLALGIGGGATVARMTGPSIEMAPATPVAIRALTDDGSITTVRGKVAEVFGPMFVLADGSGRALVEVGPEGQNAGLIAPGQTVTVQGHYGDGVLHASFLVGADGKVTAVRPMGPPPGGPGGPGRPGGPAGPGGPLGPQDGPGAVPPPPPPLAPGAVPAPVPGAPIPVTPPVGTTPGVAPGAAPAAGTVPSAPVARSNS